MAIIKEVRDSGPEGARSVEQKRNSQADGASGIGLNENSLLDDLRDNNQAPSINGAAQDNTTTSGNVTLPWKP